MPCSVNRELGRDQILERGADALEERNHTRSAAREAPRAELGELGSHRAPIDHSALERADNLARLGERADTGIDIELGAGDRLIVALGTSAA